MERGSTDTVVPQEFLVHLNVSERKEQHTFPVAIRKVQSHSLGPHIVHLTWVVYPPAECVLVRVTNAGEILGVNAKGFATLALEKKQVRRPLGKSLHPPLPFLLRHYLSVVVAQHLVPLESHGGNDPCTKVKEHAFEQTATPLPWLVFKDSKCLLSCAQWGNKFPWAMRFLICCPQRMPRQCKDIHTHTPNEHNNIHYAET